jgi:hypothetical protein
MEDIDPITVPLNRTKFAWDMVELIRSSLTAFPGLELSDQEAFEVLQICLLPASERTATIEGLEVSAGFREPRLSAELSRTIVPASQSKETKIGWRGIPRAIIKDTDESGRTVIKIDTDVNPCENRFRKTDDAKGLEDVGRFKNDCKRAMRLAWSGLGKRQKRRFRGNLREMVAQDPGFFPVIQAFGRLVDDPFITNIPKPTVPAETIEDLITSLRLKLA